MAAFDSKIFNPAVFNSYMDTIPRTRQNKLLTSGVLNPRNDLKPKFAEQVGGNMATVPMYGRIGGTVQNYDGATDFTPAATDTYSQNMVVVGRMGSWIERNFSGDMTGVKFIDEVAKQVVDYFDDVDQDTILSELKGIFLMGANDFTTNHTLDITGESTNTVGASTLNSATQKASGDNKGIFSIAFMHSTVATNLENLKLLEYLKYTDAEGIQRNLNMATWNGRLVLIDDTVPVTNVSSGSGTAGVYTLTVSGAGGIGDKISFDGIEYTCTDTGAGAKEFADGNISSVCTALQALLAVQYATTFTVTKTTTTVVFTQKSNGYGAIPSVVVTPVAETGTLAANAAVTTAGVAPTSVDNYTTYILGDGAFDFCDVGVEYPTEMMRDPKTNGGQDTLFARQRKLFAPRGVSFTANVMASDSPTPAELENGSNWALAHNAATNAYYPHKAIPIARIISRG